MSREQTQLIEEQLPLVRHIVFQVASHFPRHVDREELVHAGALGLVEAARRYDADRGVPFDRFAGRRIRGAILDAVRAADWAPRSVRTLARQLTHTEQRLAAELGRIPSIEETADALGCDISALNDLRARLFRSVVLALEHEVVDRDEDLMLIDILVDPAAAEPCEELEQRELRAYLRDAVELLPERHRLVVVGYFLQNRTSTELARFLGVTESRISQIRSEALGMLRHGIASQYGAALSAESDSPRKMRQAESYAAAISDRSAWRDRVSRAPVHV